ncbi:hypothetical protein SAMN02910429_01073 [Lachnobacterium bovis]|uniref:Transglutaminase-like domain-containing protein n=2 Tax=Lachnobacterium bovis TaxID=140626 RepID=A0A1H9S0D1_9FIRM|nr:hypothetical protein SAMN02910429_01073 [Lachnobacterium bovis]
MKKIKNFKLHKFVLGGFMLFCMCLLFNPSTLYAKNLNKTKKTGLKKIEGHEVKEKVAEKSNKGDLICGEKIIKKRAYTASYNWKKYSARYYYNQLTSEEKDLYNKLYNRCMELLSNSDINCNDTVQGTPVIGKIIYNKKVTPADLDEVFNVFEAENPQFFFLSTQYWYGTTSDNEKFFSLTIYPRYISGKNRISVANQLKSKVENWIKTVNKKKTTMQKLRTLENILDKQTLYKSGEIDQSVVSAVLEGKTVCAGYSKTFTMICNAIGNESVCVTGSGHEWSRVKIGNKWYNVDATWDDDDSSNIMGIDFFLVSDAKTKENNTAHELYSVWNGRVKAPTSNENYLDVIFDISYYRNNNWDLQEKLGYYDGSYLDHFMDEGMEEGRRASATFDVNFYMNNNDDLRVKFVNNLPLYYQHYAEVGVNEKRQGASEYYERYAS